MTAGLILILAAVLFPVSVRVVVSVFNRIGSHQPTVTGSQRGAIHPAQR